MDRRAIGLTDGDRELLAFLAEHRLVLASHVQTLFGLTSVAAGKRLGALKRAGLVTYGRIFSAQPACCQIKARGLTAIGSDLPAPRLKLATYEHDVGVAWLWVAATRGAFGPVRQMISERRMRSHDGKLAPVAGRPRPLSIDDAAAEPHGVRLGGLGARGRERLHYPDLLLVTREGQRTAIELELSSKGRARRDRILLGYGSDRRVDRVIYLVADRPAGLAIARAVQSSARRLGVGSLVAVHRVRLPPPAATGGRVRRPARDSSRARDASQAQALGTAR